MLHTDPYLLGDGAILRLSTVTICRRHEAHRETLRPASHGGDGDVLIPTQALRVRSIPFRPVRTPRGSASDKLKEPLTMMTSENRRAEF